MASFWTRLRQARLVRVLIVYAGAAWILLEVTSVFIEQFGLPGWFFPAAVLLLLIGLAIILATAWVQAQSAPSSQDVPTPWEVDLIDLKRSVARGRLPHLTWARTALGGIVAFSLLFGAAGLYVLLSGGRTAFPGPEEARAAVAPGIAVLPFRIVGPDDLGLLREGMVDLLATNLDGAAGLRTIDPRTVLSAWDRHAGGVEGNAALPVALRVGGAVGASYAVLGSAVGTAGNVRLSAEVYDVPGGALQGRAQVEGSPDSMFALVDELSLEVLRAGLVTDLTRLPQVALRGVTTTSLPALKHYLAGEQKYRRSLFREAIGDFSKAVEEDSTFALALYRISQAYGWVESFSERTADFGERAARHADRLPRREALLLRGNAQLDAFDPRAVGTLQELTRNYPDDVEAWQGLGEAYFHLGELGLYPRERYREAFRQALELDPGFGPVYIHLIDDAIAQGDTTRASQLMDRFARIDPGSPHVTGMRLVRSLVWGDSSSRARSLSALDTASSDALFGAGARLYWSAPFAPQAALALGAAIADPRHDLAARRFAFWPLTRAYATIGQLHEGRRRAHELARTLRDEETAWLAAGFDLWTHLTLTRDSVLAHEATATLAESAHPVDRFLIGALAAAEGREQDLEEQIEAISSGATKGDTLTAAERRAYVDALRGYSALQRNEARTAVERFESSLAAVPDIEVHALLRYELGILWLALGEPRKAERYLQTLEVYSQGAAFLSTPVDYYLGAVYERLGETERAKRYYARFVRVWEACDPELRPLWERGRDALARLTREAA